MCWASIVLGSRGIVGSLSEGVQEVLGNLKLPTPLGQRSLKDSIVRRSQERMIQPEKERRGSLTCLTEPSLDRLYAASAQNSWIMACGCHTI